MYDESIRYTQDEVWKNYFGEDLGNFYTKTKGFLNLYQDLDNRVTGRNIGELMDEESFFEKILFGGFQAEESQPFVENALANFYKEFLGLEVSDIGNVISRQKEGLDLRRAVEDISIKMNPEVTLLKYMRDLSSHLDAIYKYLDDMISPPSPKDYEIRNESFG